jgi:monoterpene epsilon-lactone hydrolase
VIDEPFRLSEEAAAFLAKVPPPPPPVDYADLDAVRAWRRQFTDTWGALMPYARVPVDVSRIEIGGVPCLRIDPPTGPTPGAPLLHLHGGAYVLGSAAASITISAGVVHRTGRSAVSVDYRLAPEHRFPAALEDATGVYRAITAAAGPPAALLGESAGGGLALSTAVAARDNGLALPAALALLSPFVDLTGRRAFDVALIAADPWVDDPHTGMYAAAAAYAPGGVAADPGASPLHADLTGLPPLLIQVGTREVLLEESRLLTARARSAGVEVVLDEWPGMWHAWQMFGNLPEADAALDRVAEFLRD